MPNNWTLTISYDIRFNCCNATRPILNKAQEAAAKSGNKTTKSLVSAIKKNCLQDIKYSLLQYYTSFIKIALKSKKEFLDKLLLLDNFVKEKLFNLVFARVDL